MTRLKELSKDLFLAVLLCTLFLLAAAAIPVETIRSNPTLSRVFQPLAPLLGLPEAELAYVEPVHPVLDAAQPELISVHNAAGRSTALWDFEALDASFETFGGLLGQALETAEPFAETNDTQVRKALTDRSVYVRYSFPLPMALLASWLDVPSPAELPDCASCMLSVEGSVVALYLLNDTPLRAVTQADPELLESLLDSCWPDGSQFAFEAESSLDPMSLLPGSPVAVPEFTISNPCSSRFQDQLATRLGFNPYGESRFTDDSGTTFFSEANNTLEITTGGLLTLQPVDAPRFRAGSTEPDDLVELARQLVELTVGEALGAGRLELSGLEQTGEETRCTFDYRVSGIPVVLTHPGCVVVFRGASLQSLELQLLTFSYTGRQLYPLPVAQAAAILPEKAPLLLEYHTTAAPALTVGWTRREG